jgi:hypothetical protein
MVPTFTSLTASTSGSDNTVYTTASIQPTANRMLFAIINQAHGSQPGVLTGLSGGGVSTWTSVATAVVGSFRLSIFRAFTDASPTSGAITITSSTFISACSWDIVEVADCVLTGTNGANSVAQSKASSLGANAEAHSVTFDNAWGHADNRALVGFSLNAQRTITVGTNFSSLASVVQSSPAGSLLAITGRDSDLVADISWTTSCLANGIAVEIVGATAGAGPSATSFPQLSTRGLNRWAY